MKGYPSIIEDLSVKFNSNSIIFCYQKGEGVKKAICIILLSILLVSTLIAMSNIQSAKGWSGTVYIRADGSIDPPDAPIISHDNITYALSDNIMSYENGIVVERNNIILDGNYFTVQGILTLYSSGVLLSNSQNVTVKNMDVQKFYYGILLNNTSNSKVLGNTVINNSIGIYLLFSSSNTIFKNILTANDGDAIYVESSSYNLIDQNCITNNKGNGILLWENSLYCIVSENNVTLNNVNGIFLGHSGIYAPTYNNVCRNNVAENNGTGVVLYHSSGNTVSENNITANQENGVYTDWATDNKIYCNNVTENKGHGMRIWFYSSNTIISRNNVMANGGHGILLECGPSDNTVSENNIILNKGHGVYLGGFGGGGSNNVITMNNIKGNNGNGITLESCSYNIISRNNLEINVMYGIYITSSTANTIYHNNFVNNVAWSDSVNIWDDGYPSGGNYWSDYEGIDLYKGPYQNQDGSDGVGDTFYNINEQHVDRYPLMAPFNTFEAGTRNATTFYVDIVSNSTISDFHFAYGSIRFNVTGPDGSVGFCRVTVPKELLNPEMGWNVTVENQEINYTLIPSEENTYLYFIYSHSIKTVLIRALISYELTITATEGGTTDPAPGTYTYVIGTTVQVEAIPYVNYRFDHWTLDGEVKTENPITIIMDANHTLRAIFADSHEPVTTDDYDGLWHNVDFTVKLTAVDYESGVAESYYRINDGPVKAVSVDGQPLITTEGANNTLEYWSVDKAGNEETPHKILIAIKLDKTKPSSAIAFNGAVGENNWFISNVTATLTAEDSLSEVDSTFYSFDNIRWEKYVEPFTISNEGIITIYFKSVDKAGNIESVKTEMIKIDKTTPTGSVVINDNALYSNSNLVTLSLTATDTASGMSKVRFSNDGVWDAEKWEDYTPTKAWILQEGDGIKTVYVQFVDNAGLISPTYSDTITLDTNNPIILEVKRQPEDDVEPSQPVKILVNATDSLSGLGNLILSYNINNSLTWTNTTMILNTSTGLYEAAIQGQPEQNLIKYKIIAYDNAGNQVVEDNNGQYYVYTVIPEFPSALILLLFTLTTLFATVLLKTKRSTSLPKFISNLFF